MIPEDCETSNETKNKDHDDVMLAGYKQCATEALNWLLNLGYKPGHPLIRSLVAHLTKKQEDLEKLSLEKFLVEETTINSNDSDFDMRGNDNDTHFDTIDTIDYSTYEYLYSEIKNNKDMQKTLVEAIYKGCDLQYN